MKSVPEAMFSQETGLGSGRSEDEQITVWSPDADNNVIVWFENEDGECSMTLTPDERAWLIERLQRGLD